MGRYATDSGGTFEEPPIGTHLVRCYRLIDLGTQRSEYQGKPSVRNQVFVGFELPDELMSDGRPFTTAAFWTNSTNEKATMRIILETWRGRPFTQEEVDRFDLQNILGVAGVGTLAKNKNGKVRIMGIGPLMKGQKCPPAINPLVSYWIEEHDQEVFDSLPNGIQEMIKKSDEWKARHSKGDAFEDDLPWRGKTEDHDNDEPF